MQGRFNEDAPAQIGGGTPSSRQVWFLPLYELLSPLLGDPGLIPGSPTWCQLDDTDPAKWQAILWAAVWWAVGQDSHQITLDQAAEHVAAAQDWGTQAKRLAGRSGDAYIPERPLSERRRIL